MALKIRLNPKEKIIVNGAVIQNGDKRIVISIENHANVLRGKDVLQENEITNLVDKLYFLIQACLIQRSEGDSEREDQITDLTATLVTTLQDSEITDNLFHSINHFNGKDYYKSLASLRPVREYMEKIKKEN